MREARSHSLADTLSVLVVFRLTEKATSTHNHVYRRVYTCARDWVKAYVVASQRVQDEDLSPLRALIEGSQQFVNGRSVQVRQGSRCNNNR